MDSPVCAVVANLYLEFFGELALESALSRPMLWMTHEVSLEKVMHLHHINTLCPNIKFTLEMEEGGSLPYLDTRITGRKLDITVYR